MKGSDERPRYDLSPNQSTALKQISRAPWTIEHAQHKLQTTLGALYKRKFVRVTNIRGERYIEITADGLNALQAQTHADIDRSRSTYSSPFAAIIRELANYQSGIEERTCGRGSNPKTQSSSITLARGRILAGPRARLCT